MPVLERIVFTGSLAASSVLADTSLPWRRGGSFVIQGVATLDRDMAATLGAALMPGTAAR
jgi:hypothetical protein